MGVLDHSEKTTLWYIKKEGEACYTCYTRKMDQNGSINERINSNSIRALMKRGIPGVSE
jgi:DUF2075 family protein